MLYQAHALQMEMLQPLHQVAKTSRHFITHPLNPYADHIMSRNASAIMELMERLTAYYDKPAFDITHTNINDQDVLIREEVVLSYAYCDLLHFRRVKKVDQPRLLIVAPLSGHYATLLRNTVAHFVSDMDVYITDWRNTRDVPVREGVFHLDDYVTYLMDFIKYLGPNTHILAVCQSAVPATMATALLAMDGDVNAPPSLSMMAGPMDPRVSPTEVNDYASGKDLEWFERNVICTVPSEFPGEGQLVYPGFMQLAGFLSMNLSNHISKHYKFFHDLVKGDGDSSEAHRVFYNEYLAVMDMAAPYYLDTIRRVFLEYKLPRGRMKYQGELIDTGAITETALLTIEGGCDDICGPGQTHAAHDICPNIPEHMRSKFTEPRVGHYGTFNGRHFREVIGPTVKSFIRVHDKKIH